MPLTPAHVCLLDHEGVIVETNATWRAFAAANGGDPQRTGVGASYLSACPKGSSIERGLRSVLAGEADHFAERYPCDVKGDLRWFAVSVTAREDGLPGAFVTHVDITAREEALRRNRLLVEEHASLRRVATAIAREQSPAEIFQLVAREIAGVCGALAAGVTRIENGWWRVCGAYAPRDFLIPVGTTAPLNPGGELETLKRTAQLVRMDDYPDGHPSPVAAIGYRSYIAAPVIIRGEVWGAVSIADLRAHAFTDEDAEALDDFAELVGVCVQNADSRAELLRAANHDPLTGLLNHRSFHGKLQRWLAEPEASGALVLLDLDEFKAVNDKLGHHRGDGVLLDCAAALRSVAPPGSVFGRLGGDELAMLTPLTPAEAGACADRARKAFAEAVGLDVSFSAGVCGTEHTREAVRLVELADAALLWAKRHGRRRTDLFDPNRMCPGARDELAQRLQREATLRSIKALALAIDAKDPSTRRHSDRVAHLACVLARRLGWAEDRIVRLHEAALVHDVGKIGVPDAVLLKPGRLDDQEFAIIREHAALGASIVADVLTEEQVAWVRGHHERPDGRGYPDGLVGDAIPDGARILAVADSFDVMTSARPYSAPKPVPVAVAECQSLAGAQFDAEVVVALARALVAGELPGAELEAGATAA